MAKLSINVEGKVQSPEIPITGESVEVGNLLYLSTDGKYYKASASAKISSTTELKISKFSKAVGDIIEYVDYGPYAFTDVVLVPGSKYYISVIPGKITTTRYVNTSNVIRYVGTAIDTTTLLFNPDQTYISNNGSKVNDVTIRSTFLDHTHNEEDISDLDKYTQLEADTKFVPYLNAYRDVELGEFLLKSKGVEAEYLDLETGLVAPPWKEGRFYYDEITHSYKFYNDTTSPITLAVTKLLVDKQFLDSFNESTGVFTSRQPVIEDINGLQEALEYTPRTYVHDQGTPSVLWSITHTLEKYPSVSVVDSAGSRVEGLVTYIDINNLTISFNAGFSGTAYLN